MGYNSNSVRKEIEILAPGGDVDSIKAAILAGANAVYCGLNKFNARNSATNISFDDLQGVLRLAHKNNCQVFLTLNIIFVESEIPALFSLLNKLVNTSIDGIIVQDLGLLYLLTNYFKGLKIHVSTQLTTHNKGQIEFLSMLNASRVNLSRELNLDEIKSLTSVAHKNNILTEVFVHGSYCISFSGICYMSSLQGGNSGNRGRCSQPCRDKYKTTAAGKDYPLNMKDNSAFFDLKELSDAEVDSIKIEGRIKKFDYVYTVVNAFRKQLQSLYKLNKLNTDNTELYKVFNRDFSNSFLKGNIHKDMFIDNPRDHSIKHLSEINDYSSESELEKDHRALYNEKEKSKAAINQEINQLSIEKALLIINISGECGTALKVSVITPKKSFDVFSESNLINSGTQALDYDMIFKRLKAINDTEYFIKNINIENLQKNLYIPFNKLTSIKKKILYLLNNSKEFVDPIEVPVLIKQSKTEIKPTLSVLISSPEDLNICTKKNATLYFQLPDCINKRSIELVTLFKKNENLIPWFPSILIGEAYSAALEFLQEIKPKLIVTNNTGIAYEAFKNSIPWIAGPYLNTANSYSLLALKENFYCTGSFISNELNKEQIQRIKKPDDFNLYFSIYHPILLMTSRQCLFHQITGCEKDRIDENCIQDCEKLASITNLKNHSFVIEKSKGNYHKIYNETNLLNTDIVKDIPNIFTSFLIDLRDIKTETKIGVDKSKIISHFENLLNGNPVSKNEINQIIHPTTNSQYKIGI